MTSRNVCRLFAACAALALLSGCVAHVGPGTAPPDPVEVDTASLQVAELATMPVRELVQLLESAPLEERPQVMASVRPDKVLLGGTDGSQEISVPTPADEFYLSIAPYVEHTHECYFHSLTTCTGELAQTPVHVSITDVTTGQILIDDDRTTYANGYVDFWLPAGITAKVTVDSGERTGTAQISTGPEDLTCLTSLQLT